MKKLMLVVNNVNSKFVKTLQSGLREVVANKVLRTRRANWPKRHVLVFPERGLNKIEQFQRFTQAGVQCPRFATSVQDAKGLECKTLFARTLVNSTNGRGIIEFDGGSEEYPRAPLYTEYIPKKAEYRVHVFKGEVIDIQQKKKRRGFENERDTRIRNVANGYVYCRDGIVPPAGLGELAVKAVDALGYLYGAVDIVYNEKRNQCYVLEVNSRPGLMGSTQKAYAAAIANAFGLEKKHD